MEGRDDRPLGPLTHQAALREFGRAKIRIDCDRSRRMTPEQRLHRFFELLEFLQKLTSLGGPKCRRERERRAKSDSLERLGQRLGLGSP